MGVVDDFSAAPRVKLSGISAVVRRPLAPPRRVTPADFCIDKASGLDLELTTGQLGFPEMDFPLQLRGQVVSAVGGPATIRGHRQSRWTGFAGGASAAGCDAIRVVVAYVAILNPGVA